jgi:glucose-1-phosphate thymidylyltransferase
MSAPVAVIPAAGVGARLRPHTLTVPKALIHVAGRPIVAHIIDGLITEGITRIVVVIGHMGERIRAYVSKRYGSAVGFAEQREQLGVAHAVYAAQQLVGDDPMLVVLGDTIVHTDFSAFLSSKETVLGVSEVEDPQRFGIVETDGDLVRTLQEKPDIPSTNLALVGLYYFPESLPLFDVIGRMIVNGTMTDGEYMLTEALREMIRSGSRVRVRQVERWFDCGKPETLLRTNRHLLDLLPSSPTMPGVVVVHPVSIDGSASVVQSIVGPYVSIGPGASIQNTILRNTIVSEGAQISAMVLDGSVVGERAVVRGSFQVLNVGDSSEVILSGEVPKA